ncbi:hypothetical protein GOBAR_DD01556 [Gossypium barbadense]|nr:hypothetical protein GOBAR_DD01556 [Gossypium barbadense]
MADPIEPSTSSSDPNSIPIPTAILHPRREPFEHGLLTIQKLIFNDPVQALTPLKQKFASPSTQRVDSAALAELLQISFDHSRLVLETLASVLHSESDPLVTALPDDVDSIGADLRDLILFLYIQSYKRLLPRSHKDSAAVADVWPSMSAFDGYLSALSPLQLVRSNSRRFMPSQADEEAHQLSYLQKHLANILSLLSEHMEGESEESLVLTMEGFEHLGFLIQFGDKGSGGVPLSQAAPFFANSDPDMPAAPVPVSQVHDWLLQTIASSLESITEKVSAKENAPLRYAIIYGCSDATIVLGAVGKVYHKDIDTLFSKLYRLLSAVRVEHCERVHVIIAAKRVCIANCRECVFFLGVNQRPLFVGDNHKLQILATGGGGDFLLVILMQIVAIGLSL